jgi:HAD superfamily hydrolase (TIGR01509 family)
MVRLPDGSVIRAVLLDLDDTLLDNRSGVSVAWDRVSAMLAAEHAFTAEAARELIDSESDWFWADSSRHRTGRLDLLAARRTILSRVLEKLGTADAPLVERAACVYGEHRFSTLCFEEEALAVLADLRRRVERIGLVTNGASDAQRRKLDHFALERHFDHVQIEGELGVGKPESAAYRHALAQVGTRPEETLMVGDSFDADVLGALGAGLHAAWIDAHRRGAPPAQAPRDFHTLASIGDLSDLLESA